MVGRIYALLIKFIQNFVCLNFARQKYNNQLSVDWWA